MSDRTPIRVFTVTILCGRCGLPQSSDNQPDMQWVAQQPPSVKLFKSFGTPARSNSDYLRLPDRTSIDTMIAIRRKFREACMLTT
jgi:hypothetical protein